MTTPTLEQKVLIEIRKLLSWPMITPEMEVETSTVLLALFKEETNELIPGRSLSGVENFTPIERGEFDEGWNACRQDMLERLEKWRSK